MSRDLPDYLWRKLNEDQEKAFRRWARENYIPGEKIDPWWHPVVRDECIKMNKENTETNT